VHANTSTSLLNTGYYIDFKRKLRDYYRQSSNEGNNYSNKHFKGFKMTLGTNQKIL
jgi:hypothetical protein